jgi:hypothetical protein
MELHVFFRGELPTRAALTKAMKELGFPLAINPAAGSLEQQKGFMPMRWRRDDAGVEFDVWSGRSAIKEIKAKGVDSSFDRSANFRWGGEEGELLCALCAAAALAKLTNGIVFDPEEDRLQTVDEAIEAARATLGALTKPTEKKPPRAATAYLRNLLKPLLKQRSDLMLVGRMLTIRPIRHLLRGAFFDSTLDMFFISAHVNPVYLPLQDIGNQDRIHGLPEIWQPYFEPMLMDALRDDVFPRVAPVTNLLEYAEWLGTREHYWTTRLDQKARVTAYVLAGERERAEPYVEALRQLSLEHQYHQEHVRRLRAILDRDVDDLCREHHALEAATAAQLKLGDAWQPAPFPVELPKKQRSAKSSEQPLGDAPWFASPEWLWASAPENPGDVAFARQGFSRGDRWLLVAPLTREQAEAAHRNDEGYWLFVRLPGGELLELEHEPHPNALDPGRSTPPFSPGYEPWKSYQLTIVGPSARLCAKFSERDKRGVFVLRSVEIFESARTRRWEGWNDLRDQDVTIKDNTKGEELKYENRPITAADLALCQRGPPAFGEYEDLLSRVTTFLDINGYGRFLK